MQDLVSNGEFQRSSTIIGITLLMALSSSQVLTNNRNLLNSLLDEVLS